MRALFSLRKRGHFLKMKRAHPSLLQSLGEQMPQVPPGSYTSLVINQERAKQWKSSPTCSPNLIISPSWRKTSALAPAASDIILLQDTKLFKIPVPVMWSAWQCVFTEKCKQTCSRVYILNQNKLWKHFTSIIYQEDILWVKYIL